MVRRSTPALLGLFVCLVVAAHLSSAAPAFRLDESRIRISLDDKQTLVALEVENGTGRPTDARLRVELLDPLDRVRVSAEMAVRVRRGSNSFDVPLKLPYNDLLPTERKEFPWYRLRYRLEPTPAADAPPPLEGIVSVSEVTPDLFELRVVTARKARAGSHLGARIRTANPITQRPVKGVAVEATLEYEAGDDNEDDKTLKATGVTDGDGLVTLDFALPRSVEDDDDVDLKVTARRGFFVQDSWSSISVEQEPRVVLTTDKPLYQPGQTVHMRALVFDASEHALANQELTFKIEDEEDSDAFTATLKTSRFGVASADWRVPESTKLGTYKLTMEMEESKYEMVDDPETVFKVSRYDLPNFSVTAKPDRPFYLAGQNPSVEVRADYLFGQPVKRGRVRLVRQTERRWNYREQKYETEEQPALEGDLSEGLFVARFDLSGEHKALAEADYQRFRDFDFVAYVTDPTTNRTEQRRFTLRLTKDPVHLYVTEGRYRQAKGLPLAFYLSTFYADGTPAECDVTVYEEGAVETEVEPDGKRHEVREPDRALARVHTNRYGVAKVSGPVLRRDDARADIPLRFVARDHEGHTGRLSDDFWLAHRYGRETPEIRVETDKTIYAEGEPIAVELASEVERMAVVVDAISQGRVIHTSTVRLSGGRASLVIPSDPNFGGAVTIAATGVTPAGGDDDDDDSTGVRTIIFPRDRELKLDVKLSRKSYRPGEEADAQFSLRTADGRRAAGALGVVVFDKAVEERARTDGEAGRGFGFAGSFYRLWYGESQIAGVTQRDIERLDPSRARSEGLDTLAEMLFNYDRPGREYRVTTGTDFERALPQVFSQLIGAQLRPAQVAVDAYYAKTSEYPSDEAALLRVLAQAGVDFASLRDPWGQPFRPQFSFEADRDKLDLYSNGADERAGTDDDFTVTRFSWRYFRKTGEALWRAAHDYHERTGKLVRDAGTLREEARRAGVDLDALRDRWGQPFRFEFDVRGTNQLITIRSGGPNKAFEAPATYGSDDFDVWVVETDYFDGARKSVDEALAKNVRETKSFPQTREAFVAALANSSVSLDSLRDGWGRPVYVTFSTGSSFRDRVSVEDRRRYDGAGGTHRTIRPVTQMIYAVTLRSAGRDGREGTPDDFTLGYYTSIATEQTAQDAAPVTVEPVTTFSGGTGAITGTVTDPQGAVVANATVTVKHNLAGVEFKAETNDDGLYLLRNLPSGVYTLSIDANGFRRTVISDVRVQSSSLTKVDAALDVGGVSETVTVSSGVVVSMDVSTSQSATVVKRSAPMQQPPLSTPRLREFFPETLVWSPELETARDGTARLNFKLADNITTWKMSVIGSTEDGRLGTAEQEFLAFQPFFVEHDPPRVLTEGDEISLPVVLRNYLPKPQGVDVEMKPESWFALGGAARQHTDVSAGDAARPIFDFRAVASIKDGKQRVTALGSEASDAIEKPVTVHPDGEERSQTDGTLFTDSAALSVAVPADVVRNSLRGELKVYPNLTAHVLEGVEAIMERPHGCGEQTISSTYPSILVLGYYEKMKSGGGDEPALVARARGYAQFGYERLLGYRAPGGGFTYWGRGEADLALSAYALRFLTDASRVMEVDEDVIRETRDWLLRQQRADGSWPAHNWGGGEDPRQTTLTTAFVARVLAATRKFDKDADGPIAQASPTQSSTAQSTSAQGSTAGAASNRSPAQAGAPKPQAPATPLGRALVYLAARAEELPEPYLLASLTLAALDAGEPELAAHAAARLRALAHEEGPGSYWSLETNTPFYGWGLAGRVETTALAVQALSKLCAARNAECGLKNDEGGAVGNSSSSSQSEIRASQLIYRGLDFLLRKKDRYGVWYSTQATINVFDALLSVVSAEGTAGAAQAGPAQAGDAVEVFVNGRRAGEVALPPPDRLSGPLSLDLSAVLSAGDNRVELRRRGGFVQPAQAHVITTFYVPWGSRAAETKESAGGESSKQNGASTLRLSVNYDRTSAEVSQEVTCSVEAERVGHRGYGMMLAEVGLPPGADVDRASLERAMKESGWAVNGYDVLPDRLVVYLWPYGGPARFQFKFRPRYGLNALTAPSQLYDYYNPEAQTVVPPTRFVVR